VTDDASRIGLVLAGGRSVRFGDREKALAELDGRPLLAHAVDGLAPAVDGVVVSCRADQVAAFRGALSSVSASVAVAPDPVPDRGPAAGAAAGLSTVSAPLVAVATCDAPFVDAAFVEYLFETVGDRQGIVPRLDGHRQVAHAVYRSGPLERAVRDALANGDWSLHDAVARLDVADLSESQVLARTARRTFTDVNTPHDLRAIDADG